VKLGDILEDQKQQAYLSKSKSGRSGFFSNHKMATPLDDAEYEELLRDKIKAKARADKLGFELIDKPA
jgi:hypothetical protein